MPAGTFTANVTSVSVNQQPQFSVQQVYDPGQAPSGSIGVCLSGGGSRALTAGIGELQALNYLTYNGSSMLSQIKALSTVSGGSWLGVPFEFLPAGGPADSAFLGSYNNSIGSATKASLEQLSAENAAFPITDPMFAPVLLAVQAAVLYAVFNVPADMLWQTIIGLNLLAPRGLYVPGSQMAPSDFFSYDSQTRTAITSANSSLSSETTYLVASGSSRTPRPYYVCNMAMLITEKDTQLLSLAPVQATPFITGILGAPTGSDANGLTPGGGGITSFAFNSSFSNVSGSTASVAQSRQWSLTDIAGTSSAFFADAVADFIADWKRDPKKLAEVLLKYRDQILSWIKKHLTLDMQAEAADFVRRNATLSAVDSLSMSLPDPATLIPAYGYWPVANPTVVTNPNDTEFADGGSLENTGINALLAYSDITALIAFVNSENALAATEYGISGTPNTNVLVDDSIPPLFGYQPYKKHQGYVLYAGTVDNNQESYGYAHNQVFKSRDFSQLLQGLWSAANNGGSNQCPAIFKQSLAVLENDWFCVPSRDSVTVVWCCLNIIQPWVQQFANNLAVKTFLQNDMANPNHFPNYPTENTNLTAIQVNLMSNLAAYAVVQEDASNQTFTNLFKKFGPVSAQRARAAGRSGR